MCWGKWLVDTKLTFPWNFLQICGIRNFEKSVGIKMLSSSLPEFCNSGVFSCVFHCCASVSENNYHVFFKKTELVFSLRQIYSCPYMPLGLYIRKIAANLTGPGFCFRVQDIGPALGSAIIFIIFWDFYQIALSPLAKLCPVTNLVPSLLSKIKISLVLAEKSWKTEIKLFL